MFPLQIYMSYHFFGDSGAFCGPVALFLAPEFRRLPPEVLGRRGAELAESAASSGGTASDWRRAEPAVPGRVYHCSR